jgi:hypothetical protein
MLTSLIESAVQDRDAVLKPRSRAARLIGPPCGARSLPPPRLRLGNYVSPQDKVGVCTYAVAVGRWLHSDDLGKSPLSVIFGTLAGNRIVRFVCVTLPAVLLSMATACGESLEQPVPALTVTPLTAVAFSGHRGGPFAPSSFQYRVAAATGSVRYSIKTPAWLTPSPSAGVADTAGVIITLSVNAEALRLPSGIYGPGVAFTNVTNGKGTTTVRATLLIQERPAATPIFGSYLVDDHGGHLLDDRAGKLLAR